MTAFFTDRPLYRPPFWDDIRFFSILRKLGASDPTNITYKGDFVPCFNQGDELGFHRQLPHGVMQGRDLHVHVHWTPHTRGVIEAAKTVNWRAELTVVDIDGTFGAQTIYDMTATCTGVDDAYLISSDDTIDMSGITGLSPMAIGRIYRDVGDTWAGTNTNAPALLEADFHGEFDMPGSRQEYVK